jgi:hypothetical protein
MKLKQGTEAEYAKYVEMNSKDDYSKGVVAYTERWAQLMEKGIPDDATMAAAMGLLVRDDFAQKTSHEADSEGITGFMYGCAVSAMAKFWIHGEALRRWHNKDTQIGNEGDRANESGGVLNPAILTING